MDNKMKRKKLLAMLGVTTTLSLMGCDRKEFGKDYGFQMTKSEITDNFIEYDQDYSYDNVSYEVLSHMYVGMFNNNNVYLMFVPSGYAATYYDYYTGALLTDYFRPLKNEVVTFDVIEVPYFLEKYGYVKDKYTNDDLIKILSWIKRDYTLNDDYKLVLKREDK